MYASSSGGRMYSRTVQPRYPDEYSASTRDVLGELVTGLKKLGFNGYCLTIEEPATLHERRRFVLSSDQNWLTHYYEKNFAAEDPVLLAARRSHGAFSWTSGSDEPSLMSPRSAVLRAADDFGYKNGLTMSHHLGRLGLAVLSATVDVHESPMRLLQEQEQRDLRVLLEKSTDAVLQDWHHEQDQLPQLTGREHQILRLSALGKSSEQIAGQLNVAEVTIRFHLKAARAKLKASNKTEAVAKAIAMGLIQL